MRDWVPEGHIVHFVMDAVRLLKLDAAKVNHRSTGDAQYPPSMMLDLLKKAEQTDSSPLADGLSVPDEVRRRTDRTAKLKFSSRQKGVVSALPKSDRLLAPGGRNNCRLLLNRQGAGRIEKVSA